MAVGEILKALTGDYQATGIYSMEFRVPGSGRLFGFGPTGLEIFFLLPPEDSEITENTRSALQETLTGSVQADFGNAVKRITISGSTNFHYAGLARRQGLFGPTGGFGPDVRSETADIGDGFTEFLKLRFMLMRYRDYTMTPGGRINAPFFPTDPSIAAFRATVQIMIDSGRGVLADALEMIWHDYDDDNHFKVRVDTLSFRRSARDPWSAEYSLVMDGYQVDSSTFSNVIFKSPTIKKVKPVEMLRETLLAIGDVHPSSIPTSVEIGSIPAAVTVSEPTVSVSVRPPLISQGGNY